MFRDATGGDQPGVLRLDMLEDRVIQVLAKLRPGAAKIFGTTLIDPVRANDVDLAVRRGDDETMSYLLAAARGTRIHPVFLPDHVFDNLHNLLSWRNFCMTADPYTGDVTFGRSKVAGSTLVFNPSSKSAFPDFQSVVLSAIKLTRDRSFSLSDAEKLRAQLHLIGNVNSLAGIARMALGDRIMALLAAHNAIVAGGFFRDEVDGCPPKDMDVFVPAGRQWGELCDALGEFLEEVEFDKVGGGRVNLRKFRAHSSLYGHEMLLLDVIDYGFVQEPQFVVETFDFSCNTLWMSPLEPEQIRGGFGRSAAEVVEDIRLRRLIVGDNMWYKAGLYRALKRWQRFRGAGYVADSENTRKYSEYVKMFQLGQ